MSQQVNAEAILSQIKRPVPEGNAGQFQFLQAMNDEYDDGLIQPAPKFRMRAKGMLPDSAMETVRRHLSLDGKTQLNLASFVTTNVDQYALQLANENLTKNLADNDEYPAMIALHERCISMLAHLWNINQGEHPVGTATTGSSEAIQLAGLAMKRRWEARQKAKGRSTEKPNIIMGANAQVALEKFARYFDVEPRLLDVNAKDHFTFNLEDMKKNIDENTIGIFVILGSTYTGHYGEIESVAKALDDFEAETGIDIPLHVDGASGAFVAPFTTPDHVWDFRIPRVKSINTSGHKFGLAPVGCGWVVFRDEQYLPKNLQFQLSYLGGTETTFTLNFSRPGHPIIVQYYLLIKNGIDGFRRIHSASLCNARILSFFLERTGYYEVLSDIHRPNGHFYSDSKGKITVQEDLGEDPTKYNPGLPVVSFRFSDQFRKDHPEIPQEAVSYMLRHYGYIIPNYPMPPSLESWEVLRVVVNSGLTADFLDQLMEDIVKVTNRLISVKSELGDISQLAEVDRVRKTISILSVPDDVEEEHEDFWTSQKHSRC